MPLMPCADSSGLEEGGLDNVSVAGPKMVSHCKPHHSSTMCSTFASRSCSNGAAEDFVSTCVCLRVLQRFMEYLSSSGCSWLYFLRAC